MSNDSRLTHTTDALDALHALAALQTDLAGEFSPIGAVEVVEPAAMPEVFRRLLVHHHHMTPTLQHYHDEVVALRVLAHHQDDRWYRRKVLLTTDGGRHGVEFGLVRVDLNALPEAVRREVLERIRPLGDILIDHGVMTRVEPRWYYRFGSEHPVTRQLSVGPGSVCYGRVATIQCNGQPAMELLEVVTDVRAEGFPGS